MPVKLTDKQEKVWKFLLNRKNFVPAMMVANYYMVSQSHASNLLHTLFKAGLVDRVKSGNKYLYGIKE